MAENIESKPGYYAILPAVVRYDKRLSDLEKILYGEVTALSGKHGYCFATNEYFAKNFGNSERTISRAMSNLSDLGYISVQIENNGGREGKLRKVFINFTKMGAHVTSGECKIAHDKFVQQHTTKMSSAIEKKPLKDGVVAEHNEGGITPNTIKDNTIKKIPPPGAAHVLPLSLGSTGLTRVLKVYDLLWEHKFHLKPTVTKIPSVGAAVVSKLVKQYGEVATALIIITYFDWRGSDGGDEMAQRKLFNEGYPLSWLPQRAPLCLAYVRNVLSLHESEDMMKAVTNVLNKITNAHARHQIFKGDDQPGLR